jgi:hypothetical protein
LGDRVQNGTTSFDIQTPSGNANISVGGTSNVAVFRSTGVNVAGTMNLSVSSSTPALQITQTGTGNAILIEDSANPDSTPFVIDANGRVIIGYTTSVGSINGAPALVQITSEGGSPGALGITSFGNGTAGGQIAFAKARGNALGNFGAVVNNDSLGQILFYGSSGNPDAVQPPSVAGSIEMLVDGAPGFYSTPGRIIFKTTTVGSIVSTERLRIDNVGNISAPGNLVAATLAANTSISTATLAATGNITGGNLSVSTGIITVGGIVNANANGVGNIGSATTYFNTVFAKATSAQYADLAEMYEADQIIEPGTVVCFGGAKEVTMCAEDACRRVAGVVSTNPSYLMNSGQTGDHVVPVALQGRVPVKVTGVVRKGDMMVATSNGRARAETDPAVGSVIGKALADFDGQDGVIEVVIGRV